MAKPLAPSLIAAALVLGLAAPALADVAPPPRERTVKKLEPHSPPEPEEAIPPPPSDPRPPDDQLPRELGPDAPVEVAEQPATSPAEATKAEPAAKPAEAKAESKTSSCSIDAGPEGSLLGLAALVLLVSGASLRRRRA